MGLCGVVCVGVTRGRGTREVRTMTAGTESLGRNATLLHPHVPATEMMPYHLCASEQLSSSWRALVSMARLCGEEDSQRGAKGGGGALSQ